MSHTWTEESKKEVVDRYLAEEPTAETSAEIVKTIAEDLEISPNGVRQVLIQAKVYVKKEAATSTGKSGGDKPASKRVSKESQIDALKAAIEAKGAKIDEDILSKLTGKAAAYFTEVLST